MESLTHEALQCHSQEQQRVDAGNAIRERIEAIEKELRQIADIESPFIGAGTHFRSSIKSDLVKLWMRQQLTYECQQLIGRYNAIFAPPQPVAQPLRVVVPEETPCEPSPK